MTKKKFAAGIAAVVLSAAVGASALVFAPIRAKAETGVQNESRISFSVQKALYAHSASNAEDKDAWTAWQCEHDDDLNEVNTNKKYFFLPSGSDDSELEIYNAGSSPVTLNGVDIPSGQSKNVKFELDREYDVNFDGTSSTVTFLHSTAEAAIFVNNTNADGHGTGLAEYLSRDKSLSATATGAIIDENGKVDNTAIKKIKGRGNTTWQKSKKPFNITYDSKVSIAGMNSSKKYSLLANYQDDALIRNRFLYDLSDAVGIPYASDSRFVDLYMDGYYWGSYQLTEKIEVGSSNVVNDISETDYLNEDGTIKTDFAFVCEVDPSSGSDDYKVNCNGTNITIKSPELAPGDPGYEEVKSYVKSKYTGFAYACANPSNRVLSDYADIDSLTKVYLINEFGKNWDAGVASLYFTYKKDSDGVYKFFGSPVWDYDNSLGNCVGIDSDLRNFGVKDYTSYTGWWCRFKGRRSNSKTSSNIMSNIAVNEYILNEAPRIWFEDFVPALRHFSGEKTDPKFEGELYTKDEYFKYLSGTAEMNYRSGWLLNTGSWIADHSKLDSAVFNYDTGKYEVYDTRRIYPQTFEGMYGYCTDWAMNRAAWLSGQMYEEYKKPAGILGDVNGDTAVDAADALTILRSSLGLEEIPDNLKPFADIDGDGSTDSSDALSVLRYTVGIDDGKGIGA